MRLNIKSAISSLSVLVLSSLPMQMSQAIVGPLDLDLLNTPDLVVQLAGVTYDATSKELIIEGIPAVFQPDENTAPIPTTDVGSFSLTAIIDENEAGNLSSGQFNIETAIPGFDDGTGVFLEGTLTQFGADATNGIEKLEFLFDITGGYASSLFGSSAGMEITESGFEGSFDVDWDNIVSDPYGDGLISVAAIPEPAEFSLILGTAILLFFQIRKRTCSK